MKLLVRSGQRTHRAFDLVAGGELVLGKSPDADCTVSSERFLSRRHLILTVHDDHLEVQRHPDARNPVFFQKAQAEQFTLRPGEHFVIGDTSFHLQSDRPSYQFTVNVEELKARRGRGDRMRLLDLMELPEILRRARSRGEFYVSACQLLRVATGAQWVRLLTTRDSDQKVLAEDAATDAAKEKPVSRSLVEAALSAAPQPVTYCWSHPADTGIRATAYEGVDWAIGCVMPVRGEPPLLLYLAGASEMVGELSGFETQSGARTFLRETAKLVGLVADTIGRAMSLQKVELWHSRLGRYFSDKLVTKILESDASEELTPKITEATVMFFDIRGFGLLTEGKVQRILEFEGDLRRVLTAVTQCIYDHDGVVLRYMGDGILACWNVPYPLAGHVERAASAALEIVETIARITDGWACGIGLGAGEVVAGALGSEQVFAYDILGPVANQTARVEGITKHVEVPVLVTADIVNQLSPDRFLTRRVARFRPAGMESTLDLFTIERRPESAEDYQAAVNRLTVHAQGLEAFEQGNWKDAFDLLHPIVQDDPAARYVYKLALQGRPPRDWEGIVELSAK